MDQDNHFALKRLNSKSLKQAKFSSKLPQLGFATAIGTLSRGTPITRSRW